MKKIDFKGKLFVLTLVSMICAMPLSAVAQEKGDMAAGAGMAFSSGDSYAVLGVQGKFRYTVLDFLRGEASYTYFLEKDYQKIWDASVNAHYLISAGERLIFYPAAGVGLMGWGYTKDYWGLMYASSSELVVNAGAGIDLKLAENFYLNVEGLYKINDYANRIQLNAGVIIKF